jgi:4-amino-4-deoxy-L-arabinose transferase-like glycosyltransferase
LFALFFGPRLINLSADPPDNLSVDSGSEYGDPGNYAFNARSKVTLGDWKLGELGAAAFSPIPHALTYVVFLLFGTGIGQMNLVPLLFAMLLWLALFRLASTHFREARFLFFLLLAANYAFGSFARINDQVMPMVLFSVVALIFFLRAWDKPWLFFLTSIFLGLSFLSKPKMLYFSAGVIPLAFLLITIQRGELKRVRLHALRLGYALAGVLAVLGPWYFLIYVPHPEVFQSIAALNAGAAAPGAIGVLVKNWLVRPPFTFFPANRILAVPLFLYFLGLLGTRTARRWRARCTPLEIVAALWFVVGVGINSLIGYRPVRHYIDLTVPLLILVSLFLARFLRGFAWSFEKKRGAELLAGLFVLFWVALSSMRNGPLAWGWTDRDPITVLELSLPLALGLAVILALVLRSTRGKPRTVPRAWAAPLAIVLIGIYAFQNADDYLTWRRTLSFELRTIGRDLGRAFPEGVFAGLLTPSLSLENRNPAHPMYPGYANYDPGFLERERVTHLFLGTYNNERKHYDKLFPDVMKRARLLVLYRMWRSWWTLFDVGKDLPPEDPAVHEAETMERSAGTPLFDPPAGGRFAVRVDSPDWETIGRDRVGLPVPGIVRGRLFVRPAGKGPLDVRLYVRLSLRGRTVFKDAFVLSESMSAGEYVGLPFKARTTAPGNYLLEIKAAGTGSFFFDRIEFRPESEGPGSRSGDSK